MRLFYLLSVWLHILAAAAWLGGMLFLALVLVPVLCHPRHGAQRAALIEETGRRFRAVGWLALALLILSGGVNLAYRGYGLSDVWSGRLWQGGFGRVLGIKLLLVAAILLVGAAHDFFLGPRASALAARNPSSPQARALRRQASWLGRLNLLLGLVVVALGVMLVRGPP